ncbi:phospholipase D-like domain-containing protein [Gluconobacter wancherniae]|uniref:phospholipase D-like domain-containing protein n=1 Tax=Gluconobacter wancherniae TaxID=1307955 RepID=UPI001B8C327F|nr:phospholipase D-like domain-containing protein [Gluconobacter wancherniae]MBS1095590.1 phospholipase [Gluconobacter wancherniae]
MALSRRPLSLLLTGLLAATGLCTTLDAHAADGIRIVESVPTGTIYGEPGMPRAREVWLEMLHNAKKSVDIAAFYIAEKKGEALSGVLDALEERSRAGVQVRLLVEPSFLHDTQPVLDRFKAFPNIHIEILPTDHLTGGILHAKYMIVDRDVTFIGSQNWDWRALDHNHELGAEITDARFAESMEGAFEELWALGGGKLLAKEQYLTAAPPAVPPTTESDPISFEQDGAKVLAFPAFSPPSMLPRWYTAEQPALKNLIHQARYDLRIQVMTLSAIRQYGPPGYWPEIDTAIRDAAARGVNVKIIVADWALHQPMQAYLKSLAVLPHITVKFSTVPMAKEGFIPYARVEHAKYAIADDDAFMIGTGNWEWSYFNNTVDASLFVHGTKLTGTMLSIFDRDWNGPYVTTLSPATQYQPAHNH